LLPGDPTAEDAQKAAGTECQSLLFATDRREGTPGASIRTVTVAACDMKSAEGMTPETYANSVARLLRESRVIEENSAVEKRSVNGREFWSLHLILRTPAGPRYAIEFITEQKGYALLFVVGGPDKTSVDEAAKTLDSVQFSKGQAN